MLLERKKEFKFYPTFFQSLLPHKRKRKYILNPATRVHKNFQIDCRNSNKFPMLLSDPTRYPFISISCGHFVQFSLSRDPYPPRNESSKPASKKFPSKVIFTFSRTLSPRSQPPSQFFSNRNSSRSIDLDSATTTSSILFCHVTNSAIALIEFTRINGQNAKLAAMLELRWPDDRWTTMRTERERKLRCTGREGKVKARRFPSPPQNRHPRRFGTRLGRVAIDVHLPGFRLIFDGGRVFNRSRQSVGGGGK